MKIKEKFWVGTFISLWVLVSTVSTFHAVEFFGLSNNLFFSWCIAIGFEIGAMASLGGLLLDKGNKTIVWVLFIILTAFQIHGNMYYAWTHAGDLTNWTNLLDLADEDPNFTKRVFSFISGGILPLISLGFIKSLMDYMKPKIEGASDATSEGVLKIPEDTIPYNKDYWLGNTPGSKDIESFGASGQTGPSDVEVLKGINNTTGEEFDCEPMTAEKEAKLFPYIEKKPSELNTKRVPNKLGDIIENAEKTVESIGEK